MEFDVGCSSEVKGTRHMMFETTLLWKMRDRRTCRSFETAEQEGTMSVVWRNAILGTLLIKPELVDISYRLVFLALFLLLILSRIEYLELPICERSS